MPRYEIEKYNLYTGRTSISETTSDQPPASVLKAFMRANGKTVELKKPNAYMLSREFFIESHSGTIATGKTQGCVMFAKIVPDGMAA